MVSILIVSHNSAGTIRACLESVRAHPPSAPHEVIVADNRSSDDTLALLAEEYPEVRVISTGGNYGFATANNVAARLASGETLMLLNPDAEVTEGAIDALTRTAESTPGAWVVGACMMSPDGVPGSSWGYFPSLGWVVAELAPWRRLGLPVRSSRPVGQTCAGVESTREVDWVSGAALLVSRSAWDRLGGLDERFFLFFEEADLCLRARSMGGGTVVNPMATIIHREGATVGKASVREHAWFAESLIKFVTKHHGLIAGVALRAYIAAVNAVLWLGSIALGRVYSRALAERERYGALVKIALGMPVPGASDVRDVSP